MRKCNTDWINNPNLALITTNQDIYIYYRNRLVNLYMSRFVWNMPDTCDQWFLERTFLNSATAAILQEEVSDAWLSVGYTYYGNLNIYGLPTKIRGVGYGGFTNIKPKQFVIGFDNMARTSALPVIDMFARLLWEVHMTYRSNLQTQARPYIISAPKNMQLSIKNILLKLFGHAPVLELANSFDPEQIKVLDLKVDFVGKDILENLQTIWDMALAMLGLMSGTEKKERMITGEADANQWENLASLNSGLMSRRIMIDKLLKMDPSFDWNVEIAKIPTAELQLTPYDVNMNDPAVREEQYNGTIHGDSVRNSTE